MACGGQCAITPGPILMLTSSVGNWAIPTQVLI